MNCAECKETQRKTAPVPYIVHEGDMARMERTVKRLWIVIIIMALIIAGMFAYEAQFETVTQEVTQKADNGTNNFAGGDWYGNAKDQNNQTCTQNGRQIWL